MVRSFLGEMSTEPVPRFPLFCVLSNDYNSAYPEVFAVQFSEENTYVQDNADCR